MSQPETCLKPVLTHLNPVEQLLDMVEQEVGSINVQKTKSAD